MGNTVKFGSLKKTKLVKLPSCDEKKVVDGKEVIENNTEIEIKTSRTVAEQNALRSKYPNMEDPKSEDSKKGMLELVVSSIVKWNFEKDDSEELMEINEENVNALPEIDVMFLLGEITGQVLVKDGKMMTKEEIERSSKNA